MSGTSAIFERDFKKFIKTPFMIVMTLMFPVFYLVIFGNAMGGSINHIPIGVAQEDSFDNSTPLFESAIEKMRQSTVFDVTVYSNEQNAKRALQDGKIKAVAVFPDKYSRGNEIQLYVDSSEYLIPAVVDSGLNNILRNLEFQSQTRTTKIYGDVDYIQFFGVGVMVMAIFMSSMMGGGMSLIRDREMGIIEGYLVTPVKRSSIIIGTIASGTVKALVAAMLILIVTIPAAGIDIRSIEGFLLILLVLFLTSMGIISFVVAFASRLASQWAFSSIVSFLNLLLFMTSGAFYPIQGMPAWLQYITWINPEAYSVHALRSIILRDQGFSFILFDLVALFIFTIIFVTIGISSFRRTLE
ncbi:MAG: ABC transporter [Candidatus Methanoperedens sp.]|nr:ABC transporter [Candidatus Methanoperedens sp.]